MATTKYLDINRKIYFQLFCLNFIHGDFFAWRKYFRRRVNVFTWRICFHREIFLLGENLGIGQNNLDFALSRSLEVKSDGSIGLSLYDYPLV